MNKKEIEISDKIDTLKKELIKTRLKKIIVDENSLNWILIILSSLLVCFIADHYIEFNLDNFLIIIGFITFTLGIGYFVAMVIKSFLINNRRGEKMKQFLKDAFIIFAFILTAFWIIITGVYILPELAARLEEESFALFYALGTLCFSVMVIYSGLKYINIYNRDKSNDKR